MGTRVDARRGQLVSWGILYYAFMVMAAPVQAATRWSKSFLNLGVSLGLLMWGGTGGDREGGGAVDAGAGLVEDGKGGRGIRGGVGCVDRWRSRTPVCNFRAAKSIFGAAVLRGSGGVNGR